MEIYLKIAQLYLEEQNHVSAEAYINRAALLQSETKKKELQTIYKVGILVQYTDIQGEYSIQRIYKVSILV